MQNYFFELSPLAAAYFSSLLFLGSPERIFAVIFAAVVHEISHLLSLILFGCRILSVKLCLNGLCIHYSGDSGTVETFISNMAGPLGGLLFFLFGKLGSNLALPDWLRMSCDISLVFSLFNSMPVYPLDGGFALRTLLASFSEQREADRSIKIFGVCISVLLIFSGLICVMKNAGFGIMMAGIWILCANISGDDL